MSTPTQRLAELVRRKRGMTFDMTIGEPQRVEPGVATDAEIMGVGGPDKPLPTDEEIASVGAPRVTVPPIDVPPEELTPPDPKLAQAGNAAVRGGVFGRLDEGGPGANPAAGSVAVQMPTDEQAAQSLTRIPADPPMSRTAMLAAAIQKTGRAPVEDQALSPRLATPDDSPRDDSNSIPGMAAKLVTGAAMPPRAPSARPDTSLYDAQEADRKSHLTAGMELAGRQLVGGLTRTEVPQGIGPAASGVPLAIEQGKERRAALAEAVNRKRQGELDTSKLALEKSETDKNNREKPDAKALGADGLRQLLRSPTYIAKVKAEGVDPSTFDTMSEEALKKQVDHYENEAKNASGERSAAMNQTRALGNAKDLKTFESNMEKPIPNEMIDQLAGLNGSEAAIRQFEGNLGKTSGVAGKIGASGVPGASMGVLGKDAEQGSTFEGDRKRTAIALARGLEGGMARPGNVEIIEQIMPHATDSDAVKKTKMDEVRKFIDSKRAALNEAMRQGNFKKPISSMSNPSGTPDIPKDGKEHKTLSSGKHASRVPGGQWMVDD